MMALRLSAIAALMGLTSMSGFAVQQIAAGWRHSVVLDDGGTLRAWGEGRMGQLGSGDFATVDRPTPVVGPGGAGPLGGVVAVAAGAYHTLVVREDGSVWAWGDNTFGQLGDGRWGLDARSAVPVRVLGVGGEGFLQGAVAVAGGRDHSVALLADGTVVAWGARAQGQLGDGVRDCDRWSVHPVQVLAPGGRERLSGVNAIACGAYHTVARLADGTLVAWGGNDEGQLGRGHLAEMGRMYRVSLQLPWTPEAAGRWSIAFSYTYTDPSHRDTADHVELTDEFDGPPLVVGDAAAGPAMLTGSFRRRADYVEMAGTIVYPAGAQFGRPVTLDLSEVLIGSNDGDNDYAQEMRLVLRNLDTGEQVSLSAEDALTRADALPAPVLGPGGEGVLDGVSAFATGVYHTVAVRDDGSVFSWGYNGYAQLGHGTRESIATSAHMQVTTPTQMIGGRQGGEVLADIATVAAGSETSYALERGGRAWSCGWNVYGGLAMGVPPTRANNRGRAQPISTLTDAEPVQIEGLTAIAAGAYHTLAMTETGELLAWGHNGFGQLGDGTRRDRFVPVHPGGPAPDEPDPLAYALQMVGPPPASPAVERQFAEPRPDEHGVLSALDFGATGDGAHLDQRALQAAIDAAHGAGGGMVVVPAGVYRTGTLRLRSGVRLHLTAGATLLGSTNREDYEPRAMIYAEDAQNIAITGAGTIDAHGEFCPNRGWRHNVIRMQNCSGVTIEGIATTNSGSWTQHYVRCRDLTLRNIRLTCVRPGRNNDGFDISGCEDVLIEGCVVASDDDCIVIKSMAAEQQNRNIRAVGNIVYAYASGFKLGTETRSIYDGIVCDGLQAFGGTTLGLYTVDGANTSGVRIENVRARASRCVLGMRLGARLREGYFAAGEERVVGSLEGVVIRGLDAEMAGVPYRDVLQAHGIEGAEMAHQLIVRRLETSFISGLPEHPVRDVLLEDVRLSCPGGGTEEQAQAEARERPEAYPAAGMFGPLPAWGLYLRAAEGVTLRDVRLELRGADARPPLVNANIPEDQLTIEGLTVGEPQ